MSTVSNVNELKYYQEEVNTLFSQTQELYTNFVQEQEQEPAAEVSSTSNVPTYDVLAETDEVKEPLPTTYLGHACRQSKSNQDFVLTGHNDGFEWMCVADGHGKQDREGLEHVAVLRNLPWASIMENTSPVDEINRLVAKWHEEHGTQESVASGSMFAMARIYPTGVECITVGDSRVAVYVDDKLVHITRPHSHQCNPDEFGRLRSEDRMLSVMPGSTPQILSPTDMTMTSNPTTIFKNGGGYRHSATMSLGHQNITGCEPLSGLVSIEPGQRVMVIAYSDGFGDMFLPNNAEEIARIRNMTSDEMVAMALARWKQPWVYHEGNELGRVVTTRFPENGEDDISVAVWRNY